MRTALLVPLVAAVSLGIAQAETKTFDLSGFTSVRASAGVDVNVTVGEDFSVSVETQGDIEHAYVELSGETLVLSRERKRGMGWGRGGKFTYTVTMPSFDGGTSTSGADLNVEGIEAGDLELTTSSGAEISASGTCGSLTAKSSSGSNLRAFGVECETVTARASSGSNIETTATQEIDAKVSSGGNIDVRGNPDRRNVKESSGGNVKIRS